MTEPAPVVVANPDPIDVKIAETPAVSTAKVVATSARVDADILRTEDQRRISGIWERTQQVIALSVVLVTLAVGSFKAATDSGDASAFTLLASLANLVIGFYFGRTNHQRVGGAASDRDDIIGR